MDILIGNGTIKSIGKSLKSDSATIVSSNDLHVSSGWIDLNAHFQEPGFEHKEDIESGMNAAAKGGFTRVCVSPNTEPVIDSKSQIKFIKEKCLNHAVELLPYGCLSKGMKGEELAELYDLYESGAVGFKDGHQSVSNPNLLHRALLYVQMFDGTIFNFEYEGSICEEGVMSEGKVSTELGLKGIPDYAEDIMMARDIEIIKHTSGKMHFCTVSSDTAINKIKIAKSDQLKVSCDLASYHLLLSDEDLNEFDTRYKTMPPLRKKEHHSAYIKAINEGTIDALSSNHLPEDIEMKKREFDHAAFGMINIQTAFSAALTGVKNKVSLERLIELFTSGPSKILGIEEAIIQEGETANLTLFDPKEESLFNKEDFASKSKNSPFIGQKLDGKIIGIINKNQARLN